VGLVVGGSTATLSDGTAMRQWCLLLDARDWPTQFSPLLWVSERWIAALGSDRHTRWTQPEADWDAAWDDDDR
jgi:hypothetical protein